jgi:hypothetical protein
MISIMDHTLKIRLTSVTLKTVIIRCDGVGCGRSEQGDYLVLESDTRAQRGAYARTYLRAQGWVCDERGDYCPICVSFFCEACGGVLPRATK